MKPANTTGRYGSWSIGMHWLMLLLLVGVYAAIELHDLAAKGSELRANLKTLHFTLGLSVLVLVSLRLGIRLASRAAPPIEPPVPPWQSHLAKALHVLLYLFMFGMPLLGWVALSAKGSPISLFGLPLPLLIAKDKALYDWLKDIHETIGTIGYYLIGLHAAAALLHHYLMRDNTLRRMLPARR